MVHGITGFGYPLLSTPVVALITDVRTAVITTVVPNLVINAISIVRGGDPMPVLRRHLPIALWVLAGSIVGTFALGIAPASLLRLLLATMIVVHLVYSARARAPIAWFARHRRAGAASVGLLAGFLSGTVNVTVPPLLIYFLALGLAPVAMTQALNLCFLVGRASQATILTASGAFGIPQILMLIPVLVVSLVGLVAGFALQRSIPAESFRAAMRAILWAMAASLAWQAFT